MMIKKKIAVTVGATANLGDFHNIKVDCGVEEEVEFKDNDELETKKAALLAEAIQYAQLALDTSVEHIQFPDKIFKEVRR